MGEHAASRTGQPSQSSPDRGVESMVHFQSLGGRRRSGLGQLGKTVASKVHSKNDLALILKSEANSLKTRKERVEIMPTVSYAGLAKMSQ